MINRFLFLAFFLSTFLLSSGQDITRQQADSMIKVLNKGNTGNDPIELLLRLAQFNIFKAGELKPDLDSATTFISHAKQLITVLQSDEKEGYILLEESFLANEYKDRVKAKQLLDQAIHILEKEKNYYLQGRAYMS
ncbi:MAG: hypothetical protein ABUT20_46735, partial [Bacteroidota bacterium]